MLLLSLMPTSTDGLTSLFVARPAIQSVLRSKADEYVNQGEDILCNRLASR